MCRYRLLIAVAACALPSMCADGPDGRMTAQIPTVSRAPELRDFLKGEPQTAALRIDNFRQRQPTDGGPPSRATTAYLAYGETALYVIFVCQESPSMVRAHLGRRESVDGDDLVGVAIDTFHDGRRAYMFYANPLGVQLDGISTEGQADDYRFDTVWWSDGRLTNGGYVVRFAIPYKSMRAQMGPERSWGIALTRRVPRNDEYDTWPGITDKIEAYIPQFASVNAPSQSASGRNVVVNPYVFGASQRLFEEAAPAMQSRNEMRGGLDSKIVLQNGVTLDLTLNPDYSQVESDEPQVTANRRYEVYFPEKRPFFLENASMFQTPETLFFSRRILDPEFGARLSGKSGGWAFGILAVDDRDAVNTGESASRAGIGVARVQKEFGRESTIGFLATTRQTSMGANTVAAFDFRWKLTPHWVFTGQAARSTVSGARRLTGSDVYGDLRYVGYHLTYSTQFRDRSPNFEAELGFIPRTDIRQAETDVSYRWRPEAGSVTSFGPSAYAVMTYDHAGKLQDWSVETPFTVNLRGPSTISAAHIAGAEVFADKTFRRDANRVLFSTDRWKRFGLTASLTGGRAINYYPARGLAPSGAASTEARVETTFHVSPRIRLDETYYYSRLSAGGRAVLDDHIARSKANFQFTREASLRVILDYHGTLSDTSLINLERSKRLTADVLFTYFIHPGTALYIGYNDRRENWLWPGEAGTPPVRGGPPLFSAGRQVFIKLSYLFHP